jgi:sorbitol-specific phosphotransferase system component IIC
MTSTNIKTVVSAITVIVVAVIIYLLVKPIGPSRIDEQEAVSCGSKTVYRYKYPSEFFPLFAQDLCLSPGYRSH